MRYWKCIEKLKEDKSESFTVGEVYTSDDRIVEIKSNSGYEFNKAMCETAIEWLEPYYKFAEVFNDSDSFKKPLVITSKDFTNIEENIFKVGDIAVVVRKGEYSCHNFCIGDIVMIDVFDENDSKMSYRASRIGDGLSQWISRYDIEVKNSLKPHEIFEHSILKKIGKKPDYKDLVNAYRLEMDK